MPGSLHLPFHSVQFVILQCSSTKLSYYTLQWKLIVWCMGTMHTRKQLPDMLVHNMFVLRYWCTQHMLKNTSQTCSWQFVIWNTLAILNINYIHNIYTLPVITSERWWPSISGKQLQIYGGANLDQAVSLVRSEWQSTALGETLKSFVCVVLEHPVIAIFERFTAATWRCSTQPACTSTPPSISIHD